MKPLQNRSDLFVKPHGVTNTALLMNTDQSATVYLDCTDALAQAGIVFKPETDGVSGPLRIRQKTLHSKVMEQIRTLSTLSRKELYDVRKKIAANVQGLEPHNLHGVPRKNFDFDCVLLTIVNYVLKPDKNLLQMLRPPQAPGCASCGHDGLARSLSNCGRCRMTKYCCKECQNADWPIHKRWCILFSATDKHRIYTVMHGETIPE